MKRFLAVFVLGLTLLGASGCAQSKAAEPPLPPPSPPQNQPQAPVQPPPAAQAPPAIPQQSATLPDGTALSERSSIDLPALEAIRLEIIGLYSSAKDPVAEAAGNHVEGLRQEKVTLPSGEAALAVVTRGQPAAAQSDAKTQELWLVAVRPYPGRAGDRLAYAIRGVITGDEAAAKAAMLQIGQTWQLPPK